MTLRPLPVAWYGLVVARARPNIRGLDYWALARVKGGWRAEIAGLSPFEHASNLFACICPDASAEGCESLGFGDAATGSWRLAAFQGDRIVAAIFIAQAPVAVSRAWAGELLSAEHPDRLRVLAGRAGAAARDRGPIVCACFDVGRNDIADAIVTKGCTTVGAVGECVKAGTNCGSCRSEIGRMIDDLAAIRRTQNAG